MHLKPSCCVSALELNKKPSSHAPIMSYSLSARNTIPCLGQVLTLFRAGASQIVLPCLGQRGPKTIPCKVVPPPPRGGSIP